MNELALFAGAGGGILAGKLLGWNTIGAVEIEKYPRKCLLQRQRDGILSKFPIWDDIKSFDGRPWKGKVSVVSGGFPCQDVSISGPGEGIDGERSGLWSEMSRVVCEVNPRFVFVENSPMLTSRGLHRVLGDLAKMGYDARWCVLGADDVGARHERKRIWILGYTCLYGCSSSEEQKSIDERSNSIQEGEIQAKQSKRSGKSRVNEDVANSLQNRLQRIGEDRTVERSTGLCGGERSNKEQGLRYWQVDPAEIGGDWTVESKVDRMVDGLANGLDGFKTNGFSFVPRVVTDDNERVSRLKAIGNGQVPLTAAVAFTILSEGLL